TINPVPHQIRKNTAHDFPNGVAKHDGLLHVASVTVTTGLVNDILGYKTAELSGPVTVGNINPVDRIAFESLVPGATIRVGGDLNTLDIYDSATLTGPGTGIFVGRDLNLFNVLGGGLTLTDGAQIAVGRDLGLNPQPPKGTGQGANQLNNVLPSSTNSTNTAAAFPLVGALVGGNVSVDPTSSISFGRTIQNYFWVRGSIIGD